MLRKVLSQTLFIILIMAISMGVLPSQTQASTYLSELNSFNQSKYETELLNYINQARQENGVGPLEMLPKLVEVARLKSQDMVENKYFSHTSPVYGSPFAMLDRFGISYRTAGENLAGHYSVLGAHQALMNSAGHKKNILNSAFTHIGIGIIKGGPYGMMFTQLFVGQPSLNKGDNGADGVIEKPKSPVIEAELEKQMLLLINKDRTLNGLGSLKVNTELTKIAQKKAQDMEDKGYLGYTSTTYGKTVDMLTQAGISYTKTFESIVAASSIEPAHKALMAATAHKKNILNPQVQEVGVGIVKSARYGYIIVEIFIGKKEQAAPVPVPVPVPTPTPEAKPEPKPEPKPEQNSGAAQGKLTAQEAKEVEMLALVNKARKDAGVAPLTMDKKLVEISRMKSQDMITNKYFGHTSPTYGSPFKMLDSFGVKYRTAGENLAGNRSVSEAHKALFNSPGHQQNMLNPAFTHVGIGIVEGGPYQTMFTQIFVGY